MAGRAGAKEMAVVGKILQAGALLSARGRPDCGRVTSQPEITPGQKSASGKLGSTTAVRLFSAGWLIDGPKRNSAVS
jgi:hypothetical protein